MQVAVNSVVFLWHVFCIWWKSSIVNAYCQLGNKCIISLWLGFFVRYILLNYSHRCKYLPTLQFNLRRINVSLDEYIEGIATNYEDVHSIKGNHSHVNWQINMKYHGREKILSPPTHLLNWRKYGKSIPNKLFIVLQGVIG